MDEVLVAAREALLDTLDALAAHSAAVVVIGAQAVHMRAPGAPTQVPAATSDVDLGLRVAVLADQPLIEDALQAAGFTPDAKPGSDPQPGAWRTASGIHLDVMVPAAHSSGGRRGARIGPHSSRAARTTVGIEGIAADVDVLMVGSLIPGSGRAIAAQVAGPAALLVAKVTKISERLEGPERRRVAKDAHDIYRLALVIENDEWRERLTAVMADPHAGPVAATARRNFDRLFGAADAPGFDMIEQVEAASGAGGEAAVAMGALAHDISRIWATVDEAAGAILPPAP